MEAEILKPSGFPSASSSVHDVSLLSAKAASAVKASAKRLAPATTRRVIGLPFKRDGHASGRPVSYSLSYIDWAREAVRPASGASSLSRRSAPRGLHGP